MRVNCTTRKALRWRGSGGLPRRVLAAAFGAAFCFTAAALAEAFPAAFGAAFAEVFAAAFGAAFAFADAFDLAPALAAVFLLPATDPLSVAPALNTGAVVAAIFTGAPVRGLRPDRAWRLRVSKVPKPGRVTFSPFCSAALMWSSTASRRVATFDFPSLVAAAMASTRSLLFILCLQCPKENIRLPAVNPKNVVEARIPGQE